MKEEALVLVDLLENFDVGRNLQLQASAMIKGLVEELDKLNGCLIAEQEHNEMLQTKPLSDDELFEILKLLPYGDAVRLPEGFRLFARAIEERHGIK